MNNKNLGIQGLRGGMMLWIVLFHFTARYNQIYPGNIDYNIMFENGGTVGVIMFFIISGFFFGRLFWSFESIGSYKECSKIIGENFLRRYYKLWKPYVISCIIITLFLMIMPLEGRTNTSVKVTLINLILIWHPKVAYIDSAHWFMADLIYIQFMALLMLLFKKDYRKIIFLSYLCFLLGGYMLLSIQDGDVVKKFNSVFLFRNSLAFSLGILSNFLKEKKGVLENTFLILGLVAMTIFINTLYIIICYILFRILLNRYGNLYKLMTNKVLVFMGEISFYWYLIHQNIGYSILNKLSSMGVHTEMQILIPLVFTLSLAYAVYLLTNKINWIKNGMFTQNK